MEPKKNPEADLENLRPMFWMIGCVTALLLTILLIEWKTYDESIADLGELEVAVDDEVIPITQREALPPPPPPPPPPEVIEIVEDEAEVEETQLESTETNQNEEVETIDFEEEVSDEPLNFMVVESVPIFPGCEDAVTNDEKRACFQREIQIYVAKNFEFPAMAREMGIGGRVFVQFIIDKDGRITDVQIPRGVDESIDKEAIRVVKSIPKMTPAKQRGKPVRMSFTLPINAKIQ